jgi:hypothetical protein
MLLVKSQVLYRQMYFLKYYEQMGSNGSIFGENDRYVLKAKNKMKAMWHIINKEVGNSIYYAYKIDLRNGSEIISNPQNVSNKLISFFVEYVDDLLN